MTKWNEWTKKNSAHFFFTLTYTYICKFYFEKFYIWEHFNNINVIRMIYWSMNSISNIYNINFLVTMFILKSVMLTINYIIMFSLESYRFLNIGPSNLQLIFFHNLSEIWVLSQSDKLYNLFTLKKILF